MAQINLGQRSIYSSQNECDMICANGKLCTGQADHQAVFWRWGEFVSDSAIHFPLNFAFSFLHRMFLHKHQENFSMKSSICVSSLNCVYKLPEIDSLQLWQCWSLWSREGWGDYGPGLQGRLSSSYSPCRISHCLTHACICPDLSSILSCISLALYEVHLQLRLELVEHFAFSK